MFWFLFLTFLATANGIINLPRSFNSFGRRPDSDYILPDNIEASHYKLTIIPYFTENDPEIYFDGDVRITFRPKISGVKSITLNVGEGIKLIEPSIRVTSIDGEFLTVSPGTLDREIQMITFQLDQELFPDKEYIFSSDYIGLITDVGYGLFRSSYKDENNMTRYFVGTQLRPVYARQLFPCLDEPKYKAKFSLTVSRPQDYLARSNMPTKIISTVDASGRQYETFEETPPMSTYLLTLFVFQFKREISRSDSPFEKFVGWAVPSKISQMIWSQTIIPQLTDIAEMYFNVPLHVPKMDQIALPEFVVIAMENWGINTYREENVLADTETSSTRQLQTVGRFTGHEVLHHWIGDLVTLEWWDYLWIQEAFAMYFEYFFPNEMDPSWRMMDQFVIDLNVEGLQADSIDTPLTTHVITPQEITSKFMGLTYTKGPAIIRMLQHIIGEDSFQNALRQLVQDRSFSTMTPQILWSYFQPYVVAPYFDVNEAMTSWTDQGSYPVISVSRLKNSNIIAVQQNSIDDFNGLQKLQNLKWSIPLSYTTKSELNFNETRPVYMMNEYSVSLSTNHPISDNDWIIFNLQFTGYYRILYDQENMQLLTNQLQEDYELIHPLNRAQLIDDIFAFADKHILSYEKAFNIISYLHRETEYVPLRVAFRALSILDARLQISVLYQQYCNFMRQLLGCIYSKIGFDENSNDEPLDSLNKEQVAKLACYYNAGDCRSKAVSIYKDYLKGNLRRLPRNTRSTILCYAAKGGDSEVIQDFLNQLSSTDDRLQLTEITNALACADLEVLNQLLKLPLSPSKWTSLFTAITSLEENALFGLDYLSINLDNIVERVGISNTVSFITQLQNKLSLQGVNKRIIESLQKNKMSTSPELQTPLKNLFSNIQKNEEWLSKRYNELKHLLQFYNYMESNSYNSQIQQLPVFYYVSYV